MARSDLFPRHRLPARRPLMVLAGGMLLSGGTLLSGTVLAGHGERGPDFPISVAEATKQAEARFQEMDADGSGEISIDEFAAAPRSLRHRGFRSHHGKHRHAGRPTQEQRDAWREARGERHEALHDEMFTQLDADGDGQLSREEFDPERMHAAGRQAMVERAFAHLDADGSGGLSRGELPDMSRHLAAMDADQDGTVTREEARSYREAHRETRREAGDGSGQG